MESPSDLAVCPSYSLLGKRILPGPSGSVPSSGWGVGVRPNAALSGSCRRVSLGGWRALVLPVHEVCVRLILSSVGSEPVGS